MGRLPRATIDPGAPDRAAGVGPEPVVLDVTHQVPADLSEVVASLRVEPRSFVVQVHADAGAIGDVEAAAGEEIGLAVALLRAGVLPTEIVGIELARIQRVADVVERWSQAALDDAGEDER